MKVYVESNFVLELAGGQEQHGSCMDLLDASRRGSIDLVIPAFCVIEPYYPLEGRRRRRAELYRSLQQELGQIGRATAYERQSEVLRDISGVLIASADEDRMTLESVRLRIEEHVGIIPLDGATIARAGYVGQMYDLSPQDAVVLASLLSSLENSPRDESCFITRNSKDFSDPDIGAELARFGCRVMFDFRDSVLYLRSRGML
jgi:predicted nucleic acid-binding protein